MTLTRNLRSAFTEEKVDDYLYSLLPERDAVLAEARVLQVVKIFIAGDGAAAERAIANGGEEQTFCIGWCAGTDDF